MSFKPYPIIRGKYNNYKISLLKDKLSKLCFVAQNSNCPKIDLTDYEVIFTIYAKQNKNWILRQATKNGTGTTAINTPTQPYDTEDSPTTGKVCFTMTKTETPERDDFCGLMEGCCYCFDVVAKSKTTLGDCVFLGSGEICIDAIKCLSNSK